MSPVAADKLTCTTSVDVKIACATCRSYGQLSRLGKSEETYLVWEDERKFYFVSYFCIPTTPQDERTWGTSSNGGDKTECRHRVVRTDCDWRLTKAAYAFCRQKDLGNGCSNPGPRTRTHPGSSYMLHTVRAF
jgi:hypothetical protein